MTIPLQKLREMVFQLLFSEDFVPEEAELGDMLMEQLAVTRKALHIAQEKKQQIVLHLPEIDALIHKISLSYDPERIGKIERNVLRMGIYELLYDTSIPPKVVLAEAMRITKKFATAESASFVNAILDTVFHNHRPEVQDASSADPNQ